MNTKELLTEMFKCATSYIYPPFRWLIVPTEVWNRFQYDPTALNNRYIIL